MIRFLKYLWNGPCLHRRAYAFTLRGESGNPSQTEKGTDVYVRCPDCELELMLPVKIDEPHYIPWSGDPYDPQ